MRERERQVGRDVEGHSIAQKFLECVGYTLIELLHDGHRQVPANLLRLNRCNGESEKEKEKERARKKDR